MHLLPRPLVFGWLMCLLLGLLACGERGQRQAPPPPQGVEPAMVVPAPSPPRAAVDSFRDQSFVTYTFTAPAASDLRVFNPRPEGGVHTFASVAALATESGQRLVFAMNAGMFRPDHLAQGLFVAGGQVYQPLDTQATGYGNFYLQPNGVFALDTAGRAYVVPTGQYEALAAAEAIAFATQSGPMLLLDGQVNALFNDGSPNRHIRNGVGLRPDGGLVFALSQQPVTFFELSSLFLQKGCRQALYLDGAVSQLYLPAAGYTELETDFQLGPIVAEFVPADFSPESSFQATE